MESKKITKNDLQVIKAKIEVDCVMIDNKPINLTPVPHTTIDNYITHTDCKSCGNEFKKRYTYDHTCSNCLHKNNIDKYYTFPLVEWDGKACLFDYLSDDKYFFDTESIVEYCEDNEINPRDLMLVVCSTSNFSAIDFDNWAEEVHEDWEPSAEFEKKLQEFNDFLSKESTQTWFPTDKRVDISELLIKEASNG